VRGPANHDVTVFYSLSGNATQGTDYTVTPAPVGQVVLPAGQTSVTVVANILTDGTAEKQENIKFTLTSSPGYAIYISGKKATVRISKNKT
jgi:hypothetical protein